jgi:outer membrane protein TolC
MEYTLEQLIETGLESSYRIQTERNSFLDAKSSLRSGYYGLLPNFSVNYDRAKDFDVLNSDWKENASISFSKTISLNEPSFYNIYTATHRLQNAQLSLKDQQKQIAYTIFSYYLNVLQASEMLEIQKQNLELQKKIYQQMRIRYETGDLTLLDLKQSEISLIDYEIAVNESENSLISQRRNLFSYLNMDDLGYNFVMPELEIEESTIEFIDNNQLKQQANLIRNSRITVLQTKMNLLPTISIGYNLAHSDFNDITDIPNYQRIANTIYISASWNIFNLLDRYEAYSIQKRSNTLQQKYYASLKNELHSNLKNLQDEFASLHRSYDLYIEKLALSEENLNMAEEQFKLGLISLLELDSKKMEFQNTQLAKIQKYYQLLKKQEEMNLLVSLPILGKW